MTLLEAAEWSGLPRSTLRAAIWRGDLRASRHEGRIHVSEADLGAYLTLRRGPGRPRQADDQVTAAALYQRKRRAGKEKKK